MLELIHEVFDPLPRQGPGDDGSTRRALECMTGLPERPRILDIGCGSGAQTAALARLTRGEITALDNHAPYFEVVRARAAQAKAADRVRCVEGDMAALDFDEGAFDAIWSEGAIYTMGFEKGLREWCRLLRPRGYLAVTEISWLRDDPSEKSVRFFESEYPAMTDVATNRAMVEACGYQLVEQFTLPESSWWDDFYHPLEKRVRLLRAERAGDLEMQQFLDSVQEEIELYRRHSEDYGYVFFVARWRD
uniref:Methyltransferase domain-containing protein n=1 Tax=Candidatus Kentrum eta TaxID=2126337 RepID=A0A450V9V3_9GAMM|nr:MAG: Methyltransferase domain-containing protein [Candidatus Kentron sp. H]VFK01507.1 MAG: Methyltransferase domain-containing protein [Candidatus Kentron sp. H]VFK05043.1 MAG: Methyltransferase domain-containing protein [Candidatus Kentron sp. H]